MRGCQHSGLCVVYVWYELIDCIASNWIEFRDDFFNHRIHVIMENNNCWNWVELNGEMSYTEQLWFRFSSFAYARQYNMIEFVSIFKKTLVSVGLRWVRAVHQQYCMISGMGLWINTTVARHIVSNCINDGTKLDWQRNRTKKDHCRLTACIQTSTCTGLLCSSALALSQKS